MTWNQYRRSDANKGKGVEVITLRPAGIAFNARFIQTRNLSAMTRASIMIDHEAHRLGFRFHAEANDVDSFTLSRDGSTSSGRYIQSKHLYDDVPWLGAVLKHSKAHRRFQPKLQAGVWFIEVVARK
jgi:hypothetical protein